MKKDKFYSRIEHRRFIQKALEEFLLFGGEVEKCPTLYPEEIFGTEDYKNSLLAIREHRKEKKALTVELSS